MIARDDSVKVMDFGLAKLKQREDHGTGEASLTCQAPNDSVSALRGTAAYMSPEQIECRPVDERTDIFSLGIVLYEMLAGVYPFSGENALARMQSILQDELRAFERDKKGSGGELQRIILRALAKKPDDRPPGARALQRDLQRIAQREDDGRARPGARKYLALVLPAILLLISVALVIIQQQTKTQLLPAPNLKLYPVTLSAEEEYNPHFSPDDQSIIYFAPAVSG